MIPRHSSLRRRLLLGDILGDGELPVRRRSGARKGVGAVDGAGEEIAENKAFLGTTLKINYRLRKRRVRRFLFWRGAPTKGSLPLAVPCSVRFAAFGGVFKPPAAGRLLSETFLAMVVGPYSRPTTTITESSSVGGGTAFSSNYHPHRNHKRWWWNCIFAQLPPSPKPQTLVVESHFRPSTTITKTKNVGGGIAFSPNHRHRRERKRWLWNRIFSQLPPSRRDNNLLNIGRRTTSVHTISSIKGFHASHPHRAVAARHP